MGTIEIIDYWLKKLNRSKRVYVYLPQGYKWDIVLYPILIMHDGHNLFNKETSVFGLTWKIQETLDKIEATTGKNMIVVGIESPSIKRFDEYSPWPAKNILNYLEDNNQNIMGGEGEEYVNWIVNELLPSLNQRYKFDNKKIFMAGSSMGGYISLYCGYNYPDIFKKIGAFSPAFWFNDSDMFTFIKANFNKELGVYLDIGTQETSNPNKSDFPQIYVNDARKCKTLLTNLGIKNLMYVEDINASHSENAWAIRFPEFVTWLFKE